MVASFSNGLLLPRDPFTIIFCPNLSPMFVFRFVISYLQIMPSPSTFYILIRQLYHSKKKLSKKGFSSFLPQSMCLLALTALLHLCYIYLSFPLHLSIIFYFFLQIHVFFLLLLFLQHHLYLLSIL